MTEPRRWIDEDATIAERRLLLSARDDAPPRAARDKLLVALGIGGATALGAATVTATQLSAAGSTLAASGTAAAIGKVIPGGAGFSALAIMKWVGVGAIAGLVTTGSVNVIARRISDFEPPRAGVRAPADSITEQRNTRTSAIYAPALPAPPATAEPEPAEPSESPAKSEARTVSTAWKTTAPPRAANPRAARERPSVAKEVSTLDRARQALAAGDAPSAMQALGQHESEFAKGVLRPEAELLRIQALLARREHNSAAIAARGFLLKNPQSPHVGRVRALLEQAKRAQASGSAE